MSNENDLPPHERILKIIEADDVSLGATNTVSQTGPHSPYSREHAKGEIDNSQRSPA